MCPCKTVCHRCKYFTFRLPAGAFVTTRKPRKHTKTKRQAHTQKFSSILLTASCMDITRTKRPRKLNSSPVFLANENPASRPESGFDPSELVARLVLIKAPVSFTSLSIVTIRAIMRGATVRERLTNPHETRPDRPGPPLPKNPDNGYLAGPLFRPGFGN